MNRRTLIKISSLFAVTSIFSAVIGSRRVNSQQFSRVNPNNSSCARKINAVFLRYRLKVVSFDIRYYDRGGHYYMYASDGSSTKSIEKIDEQPVSSLSTIAQQSLDGQVFKSIKDAMASEGVNLHSARLDARGPNGEPCSIIFPCDSSNSYCPS